MLFISRLKFHIGECLAGLISEQYLPGNGFISRQAFVVVRKIGLTELSTAGGQVHLGMQGVNNGKSGSTGTDIINKFIQNIRPCIGGRDAIVNARDEPAGFDV